MPAGKKGVVGATFGVGGLKSWNNVTKAATWRPVEATPPLVKNQYLMIKMSDLRSISKSVFANQRSISPPAASCPAFGGEHVFGGHHSKRAWVLRYGTG